MRDIDPWAPSEIDFIFIFITFPLISFVFLKGRLSVPPARSLRNTEEIKGKVSLLKMKIKSISGGAHGSISLIWLLHNYYPHRNYSRPKNRSGGFNSPLSPRWNRLPWVLPSITASEIFFSRDTVSCAAT